MTDRLTAAPYDPPADTDDLPALLEKVRACRLCAEHLPLGPRPVLRARATARILIVGQAPGTKVHETGVPWNDRSGDRLREWMGVDRDTFYDEDRIAIVPSAFCYPGRLPRGGDAPPRPECAPLWHPPLLARLPDVALTVAAGQYAHASVLGARRQKTMTATVEAWRDYLPEVLVTPHPSWRSTNWVRKHPFFEAEVIPELRRRVAALL